MQYQELTHKWDIRRSYRILMIIFKVVPPGEYNYRLSWRIGARMGWRAWDAYEQDAEARRRVLPWRERYSWRAIFFVLTVGLATPTMIFSTNASFAAETIIGRWCAKPLPSHPSLVREITIKIDKHGRTVVISIFGDRKQADRAPPIVEPLSKGGRNYFRVRGSPSGDSFRIAPSGDLQLIDSDGLIGIARR